MRFEWDETKAAGNLSKHKIVFDEAVTAFDDPFALIAPDPKHSTDDEIREWLIGEADVGVVVVVFTVRQPGNICRIISARPTKRKERRRYEEIKGLPV